VWIHDIKSVVPLVHKAIPTFAGPVQTPDIPSQKRTFFHLPLSHLKCKALIKSPVVKKI
jgi:hypothetical protein